MLYNVNTFSILRIQYYTPQIYIIIISIRGLIILIIPIRFPLQSMMLATHKTCMNEPVAETVIPLLYKKRFGRELTDGV